ncbi:PepSY domain-containing protein [Methylocapsa acidiphila]|uniref:PepSY domain-containing protein n=1 Tax=Methylocapsa acidiphila TaxID=133552 RepID=UPI00042A44B7|nr:PepSY domain-containing protein [Methylocapsa acidiphila]
MNILILLLVAAGAGFASGAEPAQPRLCYSTAETRDKIVALGLSEPFHLMRSVAAKMQAEAIGAKLCRWSEDFVYEISLLRHDGRVLHISIDAKTGKVVGSKSED